VQYFFYFEQKIHMAPRTWGDTLNLLIMIAENNILGIPANDAVDHDKK